MEFVYVIKSTELRLPDSNPTFRQLRSDHEMEAFLGRLSQQGFFIERSWAEHDPSFKQVIPYVIIRSRDDPQHVLVVERTRRQTEARLHSKLSIGIGGHINPIDCGDDAETDRSERLVRGLQRELDEEIFLGAHGSSWRWLGWLFDGSNEVGSVHLGLVAEIQADPALVQIREKEKMSGRFESLESLVRQDGPHRNRLESWSLLIADAMVEGR